jgi:hypothetical protein
MARLVEFLSDERAQTNPKYAVSLSVISGTSLLSFSSASRNAGTALIGLVRLFI